METVALGRTLRSCAAVLIALCFSAGAQNHSPHFGSGPGGERVSTGAAPTPRIPAQPDRSELNGFASWYGPQHQGKVTASGEFFDMNLLTAAHRTLPLGTTIWVRNLANGRAVKLRINDRGPYPDLHVPPHPFRAEHCHRVVDVSLAAAEALGMVQRGVVPVAITIVQVGGRRMLREGQQAGGHNPVGDGLAKVTASARRSGL